MDNPIEQQKRTFPWHLLALDIVGALIAAWGAYQMMGGGRGLAFIVIGLLMMTPFAFYIVSRAQGHGRSARKDSVSSSYDRHD